MSKTLLALLLLIVSPLAAQTTRPDIFEFPGGSKTVVGKDGEPTTSRILEIAQPSISSAAYELAGDVWYEDVAGTGYVEMWSEFPDGARYFSRTLASAGEMMSLNGTSAKRSLSLPFNSRDGYFPNKIEVNVVLPGRGAVHVGPLTLTQRAGARAALWDDSTGGWIGAILGVSIGAFGAAIGLLASFPRTRRGAIVLAKILVMLSILILFAGAVAIIRSQPYAVYYPLLLCGVIGTIAPWFSIIRVKKQLAADEFRKMSAMDA
jgi:hypothetical protein